MTMDFNNAFQLLLLYIENQYLLSVGVNSKIKLWNEDCLNIKIYKYNHGHIKSGIVISYEKEGRAPYWRFKLPTTCLKLFGA